MLRKTKLSDKRYRGLAAVEAAIVFPLLLLLCLGMIEYGWMFLKAHQITNAARSGCRIGIRDGATSAEVLAAISDIMDDAGITGYTPEIGAINVAAGEPVEVRVSVPYAGADLSIMQTTFFPAPASLSARVTMAKEGP